MKYIKYLNLMWAILAALFISSCSKMLDINADPNNPTDVPISTLLPSAQVQLAYVLGGDVSRISGNIVQHYAGHRNQPLEYNQYEITPSSTDGLWGSLYSVVLRDLKAVVDKGTETKEQVYVGVAQILMAQTYSVLTDLYGDIPFSESLQDDQNITPAYDKQEQVYSGIIKLIDDGIINVKSGVGAVPPGADDLVYGGDAENWERYANSLKLRILNHLSKRQPAAAAAFLNSNPKLIDASAENATVGFGSTSANANPIYGFDILSGRKDMAVASTVVNKMKTLADPRMDVFFFPVKNNGASRKGQYWGNDPSIDEDDSGENLFSRIGSAYASISSPVVLLSAAEVQFIISEIRLREGKTLEAKTAYDAAIQQDFEFLGKNNSSTYLLNPLVSFNGTLQRIIEQKWITMYQAPYEAWVDWRRTGFPVLVAGPTTRTGGVIPRKLPYPQLEINLNRASLEAGPGVPVPIESLKDKVWWEN